MRTVSLLFILFFLWQAQASAQVKSKKVRIDWGVEQRAHRKATLNDVIGYDKTGFYVIKSKYTNNVLMMEHYDWKLNKTREASVELKIGKKYKTLEYITFLDGTFHVFTSYADKKTRKNTLYRQTLNKRTLQLNSDLKQISQIDYKDQKRWNTGTFSFNLSRDSTKLMVFHNLPFKEESKEQFEFNVFDRKMEELWSKAIVMEFEEELFSIERFRVDNDGNLHILGILRNEPLTGKARRVAKREGKPNYTYAIVSYREKGESRTVYEVKVDKKFLSDMQIAITDEQNIVCAGFYSDAGSWNIKGTYFLTINGDSRQIMTQSFKEFGMDFITQNMTLREEKKTKKKAAKGKDVGLYSYDLDNIILREDGGAVLVGEQYYVQVVTTTYTDANGYTHTTTTYYYNYNDIIVININPEGQIEWTEKIGKRQVTKNDGGFFSSYALSVVGSKLYFIFNDNPKNLYYKGEGRLFNLKLGRESLVVMVEMDQDGKQTREALFSSKEAEVILRPKVCEQLTDRTVLVFGERNKQHRFARLTFH